MPDDALQYHAVPEGLHALASSLPHLQQEQAGTVTLYQQLARDHPLVKNLVMGATTLAETFASLETRLLKGDFEGLAPLWTDLSALYEARGHPFPLTWEGYADSLAQFRAYQDTLARCEPLVNEQRVGLMTGFSVFFQEYKVGE